MVTGAIVGLGQVGSAVSLREDVVAYVEVGSSIIVGSQADGNTRPMMRSPRAKRRREVDIEYLLRSVQRCDRCREIQA
jgi:hypothetical protein